MQRRQYEMPPYTAEAIGYIAEGGRERWVGIHRTSGGQVVWNDGVCWYPLPGGLTEILEGVWGELVLGYGYLLDLETHQVQILSLKAMMPFLQAPAEDGATPLEVTRLKDEGDVLIVVRYLVEYAEGLLKSDIFEPCGECYYGYTWVATLSAFAPCAWCAPRRW